MKANIDNKLHLVPAMQAYVNFFTVILKDFVDHKTIKEVFFYY